MKLAASIALGAGEQRVEREDGPIRRKDGALRFSKTRKKKAVKAGPGGQGGWGYGFRHSVGYIPTRTLSGLPKVPKAPHTVGVPQIPKGPGVARRPNPSMGQKQFKGPGLLKPTHSLRSKSEAAESPVGAYSRENNHEQDYWFDDPIKKVKAGGPGSGRHKGDYRVEKVDHPGQRASVAYKGDSIGTVQQTTARTGQTMWDATHRSGMGFREKTRQAVVESMIDHHLTLHADAEGEPTGTMQHAHLDPLNTFHPPSLTKRGKADHVPVDDVGETDDKFLDVTKRNSKDTWEQRMKLLKRSAPGGAPAQVPARTTMLPMHQGSYLPSAMMSAQKVRPNQRPVNWDKQPHQKVSYARRGCM